MSKPIRLVKLVTGEMALGKFDAATNRLEDVATIQIAPTQQGVQMMMLPYGYPFEQDFSGSVSGEHFLYEYKRLPDDLETKYLEACTNLTLHTGGLVSGNPAGKVTPIIK
ncbi:MAG: hypothetical protein RR014_04160 [Bilophila sp.]